MEKEREILIKFFEKEITIIRRGIIVRKRDREGDREREKGRHEINQSLSKKGNEEEG